MHCTSSWHLSEIIVLRIGPRDMESILCVMWRLYSLFCLLLLQTVNVKMAFYWKHKYVFTSRIGAEGDKVSLPISVYSVKTKTNKQKTPTCYNFSNQPILVVGQVVHFFSRSWSIASHTFLPRSVAFNCGAIHGLENGTGCTTVRLGQDRHLQLRERRVGDINGTF